VFFRFFLVLLFWDGGVFFSVGVDFFFFLCLFTLNVVPAYPHRRSIPGLRKSNHGRKDFSPDPYGLRPCATSANPPGCSPSSSERPPRIPGRHSQVPSSKDPKGQGRNPPSNKLTTTTQACLNFRCFKTASPTPFAGPSATFKVKSGAQ